MVFADDFLLLHERILPELFGVSETVTFAVYGTFAGVLGWRYRHELLGVENSARWLSVGILGLSVILDLIVPQDTTAILYEEGLKFVGFVLWSVYWV